MSTNRLISISRQLQSRERSSESFIFPWYEKEVILIALELLECLVYKYDLKEQTSTWYHELPSNPMIKDLTSVFRER